MVPDCPYCGHPAKLVNGSIIYPKWKKMENDLYWLCSNGCDAYVAVQRGSKENLPRGKLANKSTRLARQRAHAAFDSLWQNKIMTRSRAYAWLAKKMEINVRDCHIASMDESQCEIVRRFVSGFWIGYRAALKKLEE